MLTDIFAHRYSAVPLRDSFDARDARLIVQCFRILAEDICPYYVNGKESDYGKAFWTRVEATLSRELGLTNLSKRFYTYAWGEKTMTGTYTPVDICKNWMLADYVDASSVSADVFIKERLSLVELAFRFKQEDVEKSNAALPGAVAQSKGRTKSSALRLPGNYADALVAINKQLNDSFGRAVTELNTRFQQAEYRLHYHNGFIQFSRDQRIQDEIEQPFWSAISGSQWQNVDTDMKEAIDRRDNLQRDPAFYAARALESAIKIISAEKGWTHGREKGAHNYIDNLAAKQRYISEWESDALKQFFSKVRNPLGHGPGEAEMLELSPQQTDWAIHTAMAWIKSLVQRL